MTCPVPTHIVISPVSNCRKKLSLWNEEQTWLVAPESIIYVELSFSTKHVSSTRKSHLFCLAFFFSVKYLGQFLFQYPSWLQWKHIPFAISAFLFVLEAVGLALFPWSPFIFFHFLMADEEGTNLVLEVEPLFSYRSSNIFLSLLSLDFHQRLKSL